VDSGSWESPVDVDALADAIRTQKLREWMDARGERAVPRIREALEWANTNVDDDERRDTAELLLVQLSIYNDVSLSNGLFGLGAPTAPVVPLRITEPAAVDNAVPWVAVGATAALLAAVAVVAIAGIAIVGGNGEPEAATPDVQVHSSIQIAEPERAPEPEPEPEPDLEAEAVAAQAEAEAEAQAKAEASRRRNRARKAREKVTPATVNAVLSERVGEPEPEPEPEPPEGEADGEPPGVLDILGGRLK
jgi:hypothetical protein